MAFLTLAAIVGGAAYYLYRVENPTAEKTAAIKKAELTTPVEMAPVKEIRLGRCTASRHYRFRSRLPFNSTGG